jgi:hypothetical protein
MSVSVLLSSCFTITSLPSVLYKYGELFMHICLKHVELVILCFQVEGTFLRLAEGVSGVQQEHVVIEVNSLK